MQKIKLLLKTACLGFLIAATFYSCKPLIAVYDANAYMQAVSIKVDLGHLADTAAQVEYPNALPLINLVSAEIQKAMEYNNGREKNSLSTQQYETLSNSYLSPFLDTWKTQVKISPDAAPEYKKNFDAAMDEIIKLENGKNKPD